MEANASSAHFTALGGENTPDAGMQRLQILEMERLLPVTERLFRAGMSFNDDPGGSRSNGGK